MQRPRAKDSTQGAPRAPRRGKAHAEADTAPPEKAAAERRDEKAPKRSRKAKPPGADAPVAQPEEAAAEGPDVKAPKRPRKAKPSGRAEVSRAERVQVLPPAPQAFAVCSWRLMLGELLLFYTGLYMCLYIEAPSCRANLIRQLVAVFECLMKCGAAHRACSTSC